jgi:hypothetical protein
MVLSVSLLANALTLGSFATLEFASLSHELLVKRQNSSIGTNSYNCHKNCGKMPSPELNLLWSLKLMLAAYR